MRYTRPSVDGGQAVITLPEALKGASFSGARLMYSVSKGAGTAAVRFLGTGAYATDASILNKLNAGETEIRLYFSFRAEGGRGGEGAHVQACEWKDIALKIEYTPLGGASGETRLAGGLISYHIDTCALKAGDTARISFDFDGISDLRSVSYALGSDEFDESAITLGAEQTHAEGEIELKDASWQGRICPATLKIRLVTGQGEFEEQLSTRLMLVKSFVPPLPNCVFTDESDVFSRFGAFVQGKSRLKANMGARLDTEADGEVSIVKRVLTLGSEEYEAGGEEIALGEINPGGGIPYKLEITDSNGLTGTSEGEIYIAPYSAPRLNAFELIRYKTVILSDGSKKIEPDDGSGKVMLTLNGEIAGVCGKNAFTVKLKYSNGEGGGERVLLSGDDGRGIDIKNDTEIFDTELNENSDWEIFLEISDAFETAVYETVVPKAGGIFNIESGGVAVGMRSTGTSALPKFEVAYPAVFNERVSFPGMDTLWLKPALCGCQEYDEARRVLVRGVGDLVFMRGGVKLNDALSSGIGGSEAGVIKLIELPNEVRPVYPMEFPVNIDKANGYMTLKLDSDGSLNLFNRSGYMLGTSALIPVNITYLRT